MSRITSDTNEVFGHSKMIEPRVADYGSVGSYSITQQNRIFSSSE